MSSIIRIGFGLLLLTCLSLISCKPETAVAVQSPSKAEAKAVQGSSKAEAKAQRQASYKLFHATLRKHTKAISDRDLATLKSLMSPHGVMYLVRPSTPVVHTTANYIKYHESWFNDPNWSIKFTITDSEVGEDMGMAITDVMYSVPERDGKPYWNQMTITFVLKKIDGAWYVISDHSGSVRKSTDG